MFNLGFIANLMPYKTINIRQHHWKYITLDGPITCLAAMQDLSEFK